jgi:hypothetical protein
MSWLGSGVDQHAGVEAAVGVEGPLDRAQGREVCGEWIVAIQLAFARPMPCSALMLPPHIGTSSLATAKVRQAAHA